MPNIILIQNEYFDSESLLHVLNYVLDSDTVGGYALSTNHAYRQMMMVKNAYHKTEGAQLIHFIISFSTNDAYRMTIDEMLNVGYWAAQQLGNFQVAYALHTDTCHFHLHLVVNTVSYEDGRRYSDGMGYFWKLQNELRYLFPKSDVGLYKSYPLSSVNKYMEAEEDNSFLRIR